MFVFEEGATVYDVEGEKVGALDRVVLDPRSQDVSHILVQKGFLFTKDKVVPIDFVAETKEGEVHLSESADALAEVPDFEERHFVRVETEEAEPELDQATQGAVPVSYWYPPIKINWWGAPNPLGYEQNYGFVPPPYVLETEKNIPEGMVALKEGAQVFSQGGEHVGDVDEVYVDPQQERATHLVLSEGLFFEEHRLIPTLWIAYVKPGEVHLSVSEHVLETLPVYAPEG